MKRRLLLCGLAGLSLWSCGSGGNPSGNGSFGGGSAQTADTIFVNGPILTIEPVGEAQALAVKGDTILAVGDAQSVLATRGPDTNLVDLQGKTLMPGFVEPHVHVDSQASDIGQLNLLSEAPNQKLTDVIAQLKSQVGQVPANGWLRATGFDPSRTDPLFATLDVNLLDSVSTTVPIFVLNASEHIAYVNSAAFNLAGVTNTTANPPGGEYVHDSNGNLTGQLNEPPSYTKFEEKFPPTTSDQVVSALRTTLANFSHAGVTTCGDLNTGLVYGLNTEVSILQALSQEPATGVRVFCYLSFLAMKGQPLPVTANQGNDMLRFIGVKFTLDGSTQGFTGALNQPYLNGTTGNLDYPDTDTLFANVLPFAQAGWQISMHCNGDRALDQALEVHTRLRALDRKSPERRHRIEHMTVTTETQLDRVAELGLTPSFTPGHIYYWGQVFFQSILGPERASRIDACASLKARGVRFSLNSDTTTTTVEPLRYVQNVVTRIPQLTPPAVLGPDQRIGIDDALRAITLDAAYQLYMDNKVGSLEPGKLADLVILSDNPRTIPIANIRSIQVISTYLGGVRKF